MSCISWPQHEFIANFAAFGPVSGCTAGNSQNLRKHGVSFEDARSVFADERARLSDDPDHSADEERFLLLGLSSSLRLLVVAHCYREAGGIIRIISAWVVSRLVV